jgi:hypothetical protein
MVEAHLVWPNKRLEATRGNRSRLKLCVMRDASGRTDSPSGMEKAGGGYQTMMNDALKAYLADTDDRPLTESVLRRVIREELPGSARLAKRSSGRSKTRAAER